MSRYATLPLRSVELAQYAVQEPCFLCGGENRIDAERCRHCRAPMALGRAAAPRKSQPRLIAALGAAGCGKTVYLGVLADMLSRQSDQLQVLARGAYSISLQQLTIGALARCEFPDKTPNEPDRWNWLHCDVLPRQGRPVTLILPDPAGDAVLDEVDHPNSHPMIQPFLSRCSAALLLADAPRLEQHDAHQDFFAMKILSYLCELDSHPKQGWRQRPVAVVFTKADQCERCFDDPERFARERAPGLWRMTRERLAVHRFFATGVAGACAWRTDLGGRSPVPLRIEPRGVLEPFQWLLARLPNKPRRR